MISKKIKWILPMVLSFGLCGCAATEVAYVSVKNYTQGEYYLQNEQYEDCIANFERETEPTRSSIWGDVIWRSKKIVRP